MQPICGNLRVKTDGSKKNEVSSANAYEDTSCFSVVAVRSAVHTMNSSGPSGTEQAL